jgi:hypothetical protein
MIRWELYKLLRQRRTFLGLGATALVPVLFVAAIEITRRGPDAGEVPFAAQSSAVEPHRLAQATAR